MVLKWLNPTGTGKLVLFETNYGTDYDPLNYLVFVVLGIAGGLFGGVFCKANLLWSKWFRNFSIIKKHPVLEISLVALATAILQYPNPLTRMTGDIVLKDLLIECSNPEGSSWVCSMEAEENKSRYFGWLISGTAVKLTLTIVTFGCKVPSSVIIPALDVLVNLSPISHPGPLLSLVLLVSSP